MCLGIGKVRRVPNTGYVLNTTTCSWDEETCPLCDNKKKVPVDLKAAFYLVCPDYGYNKRIGHIMIIDADLAQVLRYFEVSK